MEDPHARVDDALEHLVERQRARERLGQSREALEAPALLLGLGAQRGLSDGGVDQEGDRFQRAGRVVPDDLVVGEEQQEATPRSVAHLDGNGDLRPVAEDRLLDRRGDELIHLNGLAEVGAVERS